MALVEAPTGRGARLALGLLLVGALSCSRRVSPQGSAARRGDVTTETARLTSLSPAITESLFALGLGAQVAGVSDYCTEPPEVQRLPKLGTVFAPRLEAIVSARPDVLLIERIEGIDTTGLARTATLLQLPWLTYDDLRASTRVLGERLGRKAQADALIERYEEALKVPRNAAQGPRVLLALSHTQGQLNEVYFIRRNSIHGRVLEAAGAVNAVARDVNQAPRLSLEQVIATDPDLILVLEPSREQTRGLLDDWRRLSGLRAIREHRLAWVGAPEAEVPGPRIVGLVARLRAAIEALRFGGAGPSSRQKGAP